MAVNLNGSEMLKSGRSTAESSGRSWGTTKPAQYLEGGGCLCERVLQLERRVGPCSRAVWYGPATWQVLCGRQTGQRLLTIDVEAHVGPVDHAGLVRVEDLLQEVHRRIMKVWTQLA